MKKKEKELTEKEAELLELKKKYDDAQSQL